MPHRGKCMEESSLFLQRLHKNSKAPFLSVTRQADHTLNILLVKLKFMLEISGTKNLSKDFI